MVLAMYASALPGVVAPQRSSSLSRHSQPASAPLQCSIRASSSRAARVIAAAADDRDAGNLSGEWPVNWSLASYEVRCSSAGDRLRLPAPDSSTPVRAGSGCIYAIAIRFAVVPSLPPPVTPRLVSKILARADPVCCLQDVGQYFQDNVFKDSAAPGAVPLLTRLSFGTRHNLVCPRKVCVSAADCAPAGYTLRERAVSSALAPCHCVPSHNLVVRDQTYQRGGAGTLLQDIMSKDVTLTTPDTTLDELKSQFGAVSGLPVVKSKKDKTLVGVVSKKDLLKRGDCVQDVRCTFPPCGA